MTKRLRNDSANEPSPCVSQTAFRSEAGMETVQARDHEAFIEAFQQLSGPICAYLARFVGDNELGPDLAQETFLRGWRGLPKKKPEVPLRPWLYRIATNVANSYLRRKKFRSQSWEQLDQTKLPSTIGPEESICNQELIEKALELLPRKQRTCLLLKIYAGLTDHQIAQTLGIKESGVSANIARARQRFYQVFTRMGGDII